MKVKKGALAFLQPFIQELEQIFCDGFKVQYKYPSNCISNLIPHTKVEGDTIQAILMLVIGDHPIQYKLSKLKQSGKCTCWRCKMHSILVKCGDGPEQNHNKYHFVSNQNL
jgi:hypothetical protein